MGLVWKKSAEPEIQYRIEVIAVMRSGHLSHFRADTVKHLLVSDHQRQNNIPSHLKFKVTCKIEIKLLLI